MTSACSSTRSACGRSPTCAPASRSRHEGPGPLTDVDDVEIQHLSLFPESGENTDAAADGDGPVVLPWQGRVLSTDERAAGRVGGVSRYLDDRADSIVAALRLIAQSPGATIVHCAAGKDRTGTVVAVALAEVGVTRDAIVADYARSSERIEAIFDRLRATRTYAEDLADADAEKHAPKPVTMQRLLDADRRGVRRFPGVAATARLDTLPTPRRCAASCWIDQVLLTTRRAPRPKPTILK